MSYPKKKRIFPFYAFNKKQKKNSKGTATIITKNTQAKVHKTTTITMTIKAKQNLRKKQTKN